MDNTPHNPEVVGSFPSGFVFFYYQCGTSSTFFQAMLKINEAVSVLSGRTGPRNRLIHFYHKKIDLKMQPIFNS